MPHLKKLITSLFVLLLFASACSAPTGDVNSKASSPNEKNTDDFFDANNITYSTISAEWASYQDAQSLIQDSNLVLLGTVKDISFQILDIRTARPVTDETDEWNICLYTIYDIDIIEQYKGNWVGESTQIRMLGGLKDVNLVEQVTLLNENDLVSNEIPILTDMPPINIGETYLFVLYQYEDTIPTLLNLNQSVFSLESTTFEAEASCVSVKDIVSYFGEPEWITFQEIVQTINSK